jgi:hypothetical protein
VLERLIHVPQTNENMRFIQFIFILHCVLTSCSVCAQDILDWSIYSSFFNRSELKRRCVFHYHLDVERDGKCRSGLSRYSELDSLGRVIFVYNRSQHELRKYNYSLDMDSIVVISCDDWRPEEDTVDLITYKPISKYRFELNRINNDGHYIEKVKLNKNGSLHSIKQYGYYGKKCIGRWRIKPNSIRYYCGPGLTLKEEEIYEDSLLVRRRRFEEGYVSISKNFKYDENGHLLEVEHWTKDKEKGWDFIHAVKCQLNADGQITVVTRFDGITYTTKDYFDSEGNIIESYWLDHEGNILYGSYSLIYSLP